MREIAAVLIATAMMTVFFTLALYYLVPMPIEYCAVAGFVVTVVCVMGHELIHKLYAVEFCNRRAVFDLAKFSVILTIVSIFILAVLIYIKDVFGWQPWIVPIIVRCDEESGSLLRQHCSRCSSVQLHRGNTADVLSLLGYVSTIRSK